MDAQGKEIHHPHVFQILDLEQGRSIEDEIKIEMIKGIRH